MGHSSTLAIKAPVPLDYDRTTLTAILNKFRSWWVRGMSGMKMLIFVAFTMLLRPHYASTTTLLRLYHVLTALSLRPHYAQHVLTTNIPRVIRLQHDLTPILLLLRLKHVLTTIILRSYWSYYVLSNNVSIVFHINTVPFLLFLISM